MVGKKMLPIWPYLEATLLVSLLAVIDTHFYPDSSAFRGLIFNPLWIAIFLIAGRYGTAPGVFTGFIGSAYYLYASSIENFFYGEFNFSGEDRTMVFCLMFFSALLGQMYDRTLNIYWRLNSDHDDLKGQFNNLHTHYVATQKANIELEKKIVKRQTTMKSLYDMARNLESLEEDALYRGVIDILDRFIQAKRCCFFLMDDDNKLILVAQKGYDEKDKEALNKKASTNEVILQAMTSETSVAFLEVNKNQMELPPQERCLIATPVRQEKTSKLMGIISIDEAPILSLNAGNMRILNIISDWAARGLDKSLMVHDLREKDIADEDSGVYSYTFFNTRLAEEASRFMRHAAPFSVAVLRLNRFNELEKKEKLAINHQLKEIFSRSIRFHDLICRYSDENMFAILFPLSDETEGTFHLKRLFCHINEAQLKPYDSDELLSFSLFLVSVKENKPEPMYRLKPEKGAEIVKKAIEEKMKKNEAIF